MDFKSKKNFIYNFFYFSIWFAIIFFTFKFFYQYLLPFVFGAIIAIIVQKPSVFISVKLNFKKDICAGIFSIVFYSFLITMLILIFIFMYKQIDNLVNSLQNNGLLFEKVDDIILSFKEKIETINNNLGLKNNNFVLDTTNNLMFKFSNYLSNLFSMIFKKLPNIIINSAITVVATFYISKDYDKLKKFFSELIGKTNYSKVLEVKQVFVQCVIKLFIGYFLLYIITFLILLIGFILLKIPNYFVLALLISLVDLLPVLGVGTVLIPWSIFEFLQKNIIVGFGLVLFYLLTMLVKNFLEPKIIEKQIGINPIFTLIFIFLGLKVAGIFGIIVFPLILTVVYTYFRNKILCEKMT